MANPIVTIEMESGAVMSGELYPEIAPNTVNNFIALANSGFYDGVVFHRVIPGFMIQGGDPDGNGTGGPGYEIKGEFSANGFKNDLKHTLGVLSMARTMIPDSAGSQFFIMVADAPHLDGQYAAFGKITENAQAAVDISRVNRNMYNDMPKKPQVIKTIRESYDNAKERLMERFNLSEIQAQVVLDMQLKRLQGLEREKLEAEYAELEKRIEYYRELLSNEEMLKGVLKDELTAIRDKYGDDRLLRAYYDNMLRYADFMIRRAGKWGGIFAKPMHLSHKNRKYAVNCGKSYGEWAEPNDVMAFHGIDFFIPHPEESTAYTYFTLKRVLEIASILGKPETPQLARIREYSEGAKRAYQELITKDGYSLDTDRQAKLVRPLYMGLLTPEQEAYLSGWQV